MPESILGMILRFLIEAYGEGKEIINWVGKDAYNKISARSKRVKSTRKLAQIQGWLETEKLVITVYPPPSLWQR